MNILRRLHPAALGGLAIVFAAPACDDGPGAAADTTQPPPSEVATFESFVRRAAADVCARNIVPCCRTSPARDQAACEDDLRAEITKELGAQGGTYSPDGGARCLQAIGGLTCATDDDILEQPCRDVMRGPDFHRKQGGETCARGSDCAAPIEGRAICDRGCDSADASCTVGYCVASVVVAPGAACDGGGERMALVRDCGREAFCQEGICRSWPGAGEACPNGVCLSGSVCNGAGVCEVPAPSACN